VEEKMSLKVRALLVVVIGLVLGLSLSVGGGLMDGRQADKEALSWEQARLFAEVLERVKRDYVEPIDDAVLLESAIRGMVSDLDAHSQYLDASEYRDIRFSTTGSYTGIGVEVDEVDGALQVVSPIAGSPAARSGITSGDQIIAVDGIAIDTNHLQETIGLLRGHSGTKVTVTVLHDDIAIDHEMRRQTIRVASVHKAMLRQSFGYIRVSQFSDHTARELSRAVDELQQVSAGMLEGLILDLRNNPGGVLDAAVEVSDLFLDDGIIVTADGRTEDARFSRSAHRGDILDGANMVVLVNNGSASASEIVAGALQDHDRALILGTPTFGKGLVQTVMPLSKGRAIKLTTSRYYTPSGDSIHNVGINPDVFVEDTPGFPDLTLAGTLDQQADAQLAEAIEYLQPRSVMHSKAQ
jgi:carboxyl-terminal processing protease